MDNIVKLAILEKAKLRLETALRFTYAIEAAAEIHLAIEELDALADAIAAETIKEEGRLN